MSDQTSDKPEFRADILGGLPQSEHGGLHPELRARITAARAAVGDFVREYEALRTTGAAVDFVSWAHRLNRELQSLLEVIERHQP